MDDVTVFAENLVWVGFLVVCLLPGVQHQSRPTKNYLLWENSGPIMPLSNLILSRFGCWPLRWGARRVRDNIDMFNPSRQNLVDRHHPVLPLRSTHAHFEYAHRLVRAVQFSHGLPLYVNCCY